VALSETDRNLLERCLAKRPRAWENFVDRFMGLVLHVINHTAHCRSVHLNSADREDLVAEVMLAIIQDDFAVLRRFRGNSSLATYLAVITRRVVVRKLIETRSATPLGEMAETAASNDNDFEQRISDHEEVERLLKQLNGNEAEVVRLYHLEGKSYQEISRTVGMPTNSVGPLLTRVRTKLRGIPHA
jgi:RNA polymerase sigma-70 factor (ECF subfamily)